MANTAVKVADKFCNMAFADVTESAANTLTFSEIQTGVSIFEKVAWVINRILWYPSFASINLIIASDDYIEMALVTSNKVDTLHLDEPAVIDALYIGLEANAALADAHQLVTPIVHDFAGLPGGGLIVPPKPLHLAAKATSIASASTISARIYFTQKGLKPEEYWELVEARRMVE